MITVLRDIEPGYAERLALIALLAEGYIRTTKLTLEERHGQVH